MNEELAYRLAKESRIDITQIVREEWEIKILKEIFESPLGNSIYFKGGTALRLVYNSPRYSDDLDFTLVKRISKKSWEDMLKNIIKKFPEVIISDQKDKFYTYFGELKIKEDYLPLSFSIKIEISKRIKNKYKYSLKLLTSKTTNIQILAQVEDLEEIRKEKKLAINSRNLPRDLFDLWFIAQKMKEPMDKNLQKIATETYSPAYISFESAFSYYGILSQAPYDLFLATTNRSKKTEIAGQEIIYRKIKKELFFGYDLIDEIYIAKKEKSLLDILYFFDKGIIMLDLKSLDLKSINKKILSKYAQKFPERIQKTAKKLLQDYEN